MNSSEIISKLRNFPPDDHTGDEFMLFLRIGLQYIAAHVNDARLADGQRLCDVTDFRAFLLECVDRASVPRMEQQPNGVTK